MKKDYLLSICIPTYNREKYLKRLLESVFSQTAFNEEIEVIINDWPSKDNTEVLVETYLAKYNNIKYYRNNKAIGMTPAIMESVSYSNWKYTWIFSSDDVMAPHALKHLVTVLKKHFPKLIINNRLVFYKEDEYVNLSHKKINYTLFKWFSSFSSFLGERLSETLIEKMDYFTFMSIACFETDHYKKSLEIILKSNMISLYDLNWNYFNRALIIYSNLQFEDRIILINNKNVYAQADNAWWSKNKKIIDDLSWLFNNLLSQYSINNWWKLFFQKTINYWKFSFSILHPILQNKLVSFIKNNKITKKIYIIVSSLVNFVLKRVL